MSAMAVTDSQWKSFARKYANRGLAVPGDDPAEAWTNAHRIYGKHLTFSEADFITACRAQGIEPRLTGGYYTLELRT